MQIPSELRSLFKQVAQLRQRDRAKLASFSINVQLIRKITNLHFKPPHGEIRGNISALSEGFNAKKHCSRVLLYACQSYS